METKFQTSFIPKKPLLNEQRSISVKAGTNILLVIGSVIFIASVAGAIFSVVWISVLNKDQQNFKIKLAESEKRFNTSLIENLKKANTKIDLSKQLLKNHLATPEIFSIISELTTEDVRFNSFSFSAPTSESEGIKIVLAGVAKSFGAIAFQSDILGSSAKYGKNIVLKNPVISDVSETEDGSIRFGFSATLNTKDILYTKVLGESTQ